jgi:hypothetical protein
VIVDLIKVNNALVPSLEQDRLIIDKVKHGVILSYELTRKRNRGFHRKFFGLLDVVCANCNYNIDQLLHVIKLKLGHFETVISTKGKVTYMTKTISFAGMDQDTFEIFYNRTIDIVLRDFFTNTPKHRLEAEVSMVLGFT